MSIHGCLWRRKLFKAFTFSKVYPSFAFIGGKKVE
jgi:hypothetical protein